MSSCGFVMVEHVLLKNGDKRAVNWANMLKLTLCTFHGLVQIMLITVVKLAFILAIFEILISYPQA